ncbi:DgyrCDS828 [Dimorphilus gyrociliatus]|uniref:DgyrCDS828 n=1 Tax=Dimorphilus gyrociliatus TaxID=2664684 RepID=A0A7I8V5T5_9ANNE|nr:DgyrCDS828 [Dimorphilus gyrociliatus]
MLKGTPVKYRHVYLNESKGNADKSLKKKTLSVEARLVLDDLKQDNVRKWSSDYKDRNRSNRVRQEEDGKRFKSREIRNGIVDGACNSTCGLDEQSLPINNEYNQQQLAYSNLKREKSFQITPIGYDCRYVQEKRVEVNAEEPTGYEKQVAISKCNKWLNNYVTGNSKRKISRTERQ